MVDSFGANRANQEFLNQLEAGLILEPTRLKVLFAFVPIAVTAAMQTTMIKASMTAYSTAVGPSSAFRKFTKIRVIDFMGYRTFLVVIEVGV